MEFLKDDIHFERASNYCDKAHFLGSRVFTVDILRYHFLVLTAFIMRKSPPKWLQIEFNFISAENSSIPQMSSSSHCVHVCSKSIITSSMKQVDHFKPLAIFLFFKENFNFLHIENWKISCINQSQIIGIRYAEKDSAYLQTTFSIFVY